MSWSSLAAVGKYHRLGGLGNRHLFLSLLEAEKSKIKCWQLMSGEGSHPALQTAAFLLCPHMTKKGRKTKKRGMTGERERERTSSHKANNPIRLTLFYLIQLPKAHLHIQAHCGLGRHCIIWKHTVQASPDTDA